MNIKEFQIKNKDQISAILEHAKRAPKGEAISQLVGVPIFINEEVPAGVLRAILMGGLVMDFNLR